MRNNQPPDYFDLGQRFVQECTAKYSFLQRLPGATLVSGLRTSPATRLHELKRPLHAWFALVVRYVIHEVTFQITYGDRELAILPCVILAGNEYGQWEILKANGVAIEDLAPENFVHKIDHIVRVVRRQSSSLKTNLPLFLNVTPETIRKVEMNRQQASSDWNRQLQTRQLRREYPKARALFAARKYADAYAILKPYETFFGDSERKLLRICEMRMGGNALRNGG